MGHKKFTHIEGMHLVPDAGSSLLVQNALVKSAHFVEIIFVVVLIICSEHIGRSRCWLFKTGASLLDKNP
jgi:hypothetical protein